MKPQIAKYHVSGYNADGCKIQEIHTTRMGSALKIQKWMLADCHSVTIYKTEWKGVFKQLSTQV